MATTPTAKYNPRISNASRMTSFSCGSKAISSSLLNVNDFFKIANTYFLYHDMLKSYIKKNSGPAFFSMKWSIAEHTGGAPGRKGAIDSLRQDFRTAEME